MSSLTLAVLTALSLLSGGALSAQGVSVVSCPFSGSATNPLANGFYVTDYPGNNLSQVTLGYATPIAGRYGILLTAHRNAYDGPLIGTTQTAVVNLPANGETLVTFDFGGAPVSPGDTIAFTQEYEILGPTGASISYDAGLGPCPGVFGTNGDYPPLGLPSTFSAGVTITQVNQSAQLCTPSDTVLCVDDFPGDRRFQVTASFHTTQAGGHSGDGQAVPLSPLGVIHGGLFWFFSPDNPEVLVKVLNGCAINNHYWVYIAAGTNVGFTVTVADSRRSNTKTYSNPDRKPAAPIQDTFALASCGSCTSDADCRTGLLCCFVPGGNHVCVAPSSGGVCPALP